MFFGRREREGGSLLSLTGFPIASTDTARACVYREIREARRRLGDPAISKRHAQPTHPHFPATCWSVARQRSAAINTKQLPPRHRPHKRCGSRWHPAYRPTLFLALIPLGLFENVEDTSHYTSSAVCLRSNTTALFPGLESLTVRHAQASSHQ